MPFRENSYIWLTFLSAPATGAPIGPTNYQAQQCENHPLDVLQYLYMYATT
ncbi:Hypothetical predicted protein, partial [Olea europaea subsp. europaea]